MNMFTPQLFSDQLDAQLFPAEVNEGQDSEYIPTPVSPQSQLVYDHAGQVQSHAEYVPEEAGSQQYTPRYVTDHHEAYTPQYVTHHNTRVHHHHQDKPPLKFVYPNSQYLQQQTQQAHHQVHHQNMRATMQSPLGKAQAQAQARRTQPQPVDAPPSLFRNRFQVLERLEDDNQLFECETEEEEEADNLKRVRETDCSPSCSFRWPGWPGDNVYRLVVPEHMVGPIIGRKGELVKKICEETKARIKILKGVPRTAERVVMVFARGEPEASVPPAMEAMVRVHRRIIDANREYGELSWSMTSRLLIPPGQAGSIIGKQGVTVKSMHDASGAHIHVLSPEDVPPYALHGDRLVEVHGSVENVHHGVELILSHLRKFLVDRSILPLFEHSKFKVCRNPQETLALQTTSQQLTVSMHGKDPVGGKSPPPTAKPVISLSSASPPVAPPAPPSPLAATQVKQLIQIPLSYADAIIGTSGANISYMRRTSNASITIQETSNVPGEMTVEIQGTSQQVRYAHQLIEEFVQRSQTQCTFPGQQGGAGYPAMGPGHAYYPTPAYGF